MLGGMLAGNENKEACSTCVEMAQDNREAQQCMSFPLFPPTPSLTSPGQHSRASPGDGTVESPPGCESGRIDPTTLWLCGGLDFGKDNPRPLAV